MRRKYFGLWLLISFVILTGFTQVFAESDSKQASVWIDRTTVSGMNILLQKTNSKVIDIVLLLKSGSGLDPSAKKGTALIMNNIVYFKLRFSKAKIGEINVETYPDYSLISIKTTTSGFQKALDEVKDLLSNPIYSYDWLTDLKGLYSTDLKGVSPFYKAYSDFTAQFYGAEHPYNDQMDPDKIKTISGKDIYQWYRQTYQPGNAILSITGAVTKSIKDLNKFFSNMITESVDRRLMITPVSVDKDVQLDREEINGRVTTISIGCTAPRFSDPDYPAFRVIAYYLEDYMHYFEELRVKEGLFYAGFVVYNYFEKPKAPNIVFLTMTDPGSLKKVEQKTIGIVAKLVEEGISQTEIDKVVSAMKANNAGLLESEKNYAVRNALSQLLQTQLVYDENLLAKLTQVKTEDIKLAAAKYLRHYIRVAYTPREMAENF
jgi:predicted Zn-dependent peptidase